MAVSQRLNPRSVAAPGGRPLLFIGGEWVEATGTETLPTFDPATGNRLMDVPVAQPRDVARAVEAARDGQRAWVALPPGQRAARLVDLARRLREMADELLRTEAIDAGMPVRVVQRDLDKAIDALETNARLAEELRGTVVNETAGSLLYSIRQPYGVVAVITPFNHPLMFSLTKTAPALVTGNAVVLKPPSAAPLTTLLVADATRGILPPGVFNVVTGSAATGSALVADPRVGKVSFTGSGATGAGIMALAAQNITPVLLELGGKNASLVLPDMDVDEAVAGAVAGMALNTCGQSCQSATRAFVHRSLHDRFVETLGDALSRVRVGDPLDERTGMGPVVSRRQLEAVSRYIQLGRDEGAVLATGGGRPSLDESLAAGFFVEPTVFTAVRPEMTIARDEIFGPVLSVFAWDDLDAAIDAINASPYGLTASVWTNRLDAHAIAARLEVGYVFVNRHGGAVRQLPLGGWKQSGIGTSNGPWELEEFTRHKAVEVRIP